MSNKLPVPGQTYPIRLGASMKTETVGERSHIHTVSYSFRPASADTMATGAVVFDESEARNVSIEFPNKSASAASVCMSGKQVQTTKRDCLLLFDPVGQCFVLEKVASATRDVKKAPLQFDPSLLPRTTRASRTTSAAAAAAATGGAAAAAAEAPPARVKLDASSASQVKLTSSSVIHRILDDDDDDGSSSDDGGGGWAI